jgi:hypothetical protein
MVRQSFSIGSSCVMKHAVAMLEGPPGRIHRLPALSAFMILEQ